ncbi:MAG TPA: glycosyltransferase, partial [Candidatus Elarobacter sp.]
HAAAVMCDSRFSANEFRALIDADAAIDVVYPGVDGRFAHIVRARDDVRPFALVVGTVEARKNLKVLIDALPAIPRLRIVAVGPPTAYADECRARAAELGVAGRVELRGYVGREELDGLYAQASCALVPSRYEGFGYALAEALCAGLPVVAARTSSLIEVAGDGVPLLDPDDASAWSTTVNAMLSDPEGTEAAARERRAGAIARFAWATAAARVKGVYERVLG